MPRQSWTSSTVQVLVLRLVPAIGLVGDTGLVRTILAFGTILVFGQMREAGRTFLHRPHGRRAVATATSL